ncbi:Aerobic respiration control sensor protein ArcB [Thalassovita gelatinovora]|uniref:histidine kinase n=1 Tax=Thalassovita gelatinovora TaxID=53501 RepID=A0A0P1FT36_THAGE|nr:ATP-binding protein [Thalassovita gelatinovora]QIZ79260.1 response regulator [Thalassovita gelatinovora]CUH62457.1 Aerobic respiration control sensor protein ArcB [Thalassovita gelatinovora]SEQ04678.1 PAS domain S-box-containing protein [Thalassovita gelatinovora]
MRGRQELRRKFRWIHIFLLCVAVSVTLVLSIQLWALSAQKIKDLRSSKTDNVVWTLGQLEVEFQQLELSLQNLVLTQGDPSAAAAEVRRRFDVYYSRVEILSDSPLYQMALVANDNVVTLQQFKKQNDRLAPLIDAPDDLLAENAARLYAEFNAVEKLVRQVSVRGNAVWAAQGEKARDEVGAIMFRLSIVTVILMASLGMLAVLLFRLNLQNAKSAREHKATSVRLSEVLGTTSDALVVTDGNGRIVEFNRVAEELLKTERGAALGQAFDRCLLNERGDFARLPFVSSGRISGLQLHLKSADGRVIPVEVSQGVAKIETAKFHVYFLRDITERKNAERALRQSRDRAQAGERVKSRFLAVMSHEMRTPLNGILGVVDLMRDGQNLTAREFDHYLDLLQNSGQTLLTHVNDVLDITQLEADDITLSEGRFDFDVLLERLIAPMQLVAARRGNQLLLEKPPESLGCFIGDEKRLHQVLLNLLGNAVKFTENGVITVTVNASRIKGQDTTELEVQISDTGVGVAEDEQTRIFDDFVRIEDQTREQREGTGLGLGIAKRIVTAMGGDIGVESIFGEGSVFWIRIALRPAKMAERLSPDEDDMAVPEKALSVLIVEDNPTNRFVLSELLTRDGHRVAEAVNGKDGVEIARQEPFDVILMDVSMPVMGGLEAARLIRMGGASCESRIVAVTAHVFDQDTTEFRDAGMDAAVSKPISRKSIRAVLTGEGRMDADRNDTALLDRIHLRQVMQSLGPQKGHKLIEDFCLEARDVLAGLDQTDWQTSGDIAIRLHRLAGTAALSGAKRFRTALNQMESSLQAGDRQDLSKWAPFLSSLWAETRAELKDFLADADSSDLSDRNNARL